MTMQKESSEVDSAGARENLLNAGSMLFDISLNQEIAESNILSLH